MSGNDCDPPGSCPETDQAAEFIDVLALNRYYGWYMDGGNPEADKADPRKEFRAGWNKG